MTKLPSKILIQLEAHQENTDSKHSNSMLHPRTMILRMMISEMLMSTRIWTKTHCKTKDTNKIMELQWMEHRTIWNQIFKGLWTKLHRSLKKEEWWRGRINLLSTKNINSSREFHSTTMINFKIIKTTSYRCLTTTSEIKKRTLSGKKTRISNQSKRTQMRWMITSLQMALKGPKTSTKLTTN